jgi:hypothetical protein
VVNSNVLIWTEGDADMTFALSYPPPTSICAPTEEYVIHPTFCVPLGAGTLLVFSPEDDLFFCHEAFFEYETGGSHRMAFVFRWLTQARDFYTGEDGCKDVNKMKLSRELVERAAARKRQKAQKRENDKRASLRRY